MSDLGPCAEEAFKEEMMSNGLTLPFSGNVDTDGIVFEIIQGLWPENGQGGIAIKGSSFGRKGNGSPGVGVYGLSDIGSGVHGESYDADGVTGSGEDGTGVHGMSKNADGVRGESRSNAHAGVSAINDSGGFGVWARGRVGGHFEGDVEINGVLKAEGNAGVAGILGVGGGILVGCAAPTNAGIVAAASIRAEGGQDDQGDAHVGGTLNVDVDVVLTGCAEEFDVSSGDMVAPGTVMVIDQQGALQPSHKAYDRNVAGVVSGAGSCKPGIVLGRRPSANSRLAVALVGKVYCKIDAQYAPVQVGDLLTTSPTPGHAMKAEDPSRAFGSVIGKALQAVHGGRELIPILVALQ
jgi:hypothetical protein